MTGSWLLLILLIGLGISLYFCYRRKPHDDGWRNLPPPNWRCRRGGKDYL